MKFPLSIILVFLVLTNVSFGQRADWVLSPVQVKENSTFKLNLESFRYNCTVKFSHHKVTVDQNQITLFFLATQDSAPICPGVFRPYGGEFEIPALKSGPYKVTAVPLLPCHVNNPPCRVAFRYEEAGKIQVGTPTSINWFIDPKKSIPAKEFTLKLLSHDVGDCNFEFTNTEAQARNEGIYLQFVMIHRPERICIVDNRPFGPSYKLAAMKEGKYPVFAWSRKACELQNPGCLPISSPILVDTLEVTTDTTSRSWLAPTLVIPRQNFVLQIFSEGYNCNSKFSNQKAEVRGNSITLSYNYSETRRLCPDTAFVGVAEFQVAGLMPGDYSVFILPPNPCAFTSFACSEEYKTKSFGAIQVRGLVTVHPERKAMDFSYSFESRRILIQFKNASTHEIQLEGILPNGEILFSKKGIVQEGIAIFPLPNKRYSESFYLRVRGKGWEEVLPDRF